MKSSTNDPHREEKSELDSCLVSHRALSLSELLHCSSSSYRIFGEEVAEAENSPFQRAPLRPAPFYTEPNGNSMPAQEVEPWNRPYASRPGDIQPTNIGRANGRSGSMRAGHLEREDSRWWDWSGNKATEPRSITQAADDRMIKRGNSFQNVFHEGG